jgi:hypothetical protein
MAAVSRFDRSRQAAAGAFAWDGQFERIAADRVPNWGIRAERIEDLVSAWSAGEADAASAVMATAKVLALLDWGFGGDRGLWSRAAEKAVRFLASATGRSVEDVTAWLTSV